MRAPRDETNKTASAGPAPIGHSSDAQRELLNRTLATWAWNKQFEDAQAEIAQHLAEAYAEALEPLTPKQIGKKQGMQRVLMLRNFTLAAVAKYCRLNPQADTRLAILVWIAFSADNDDGVGELPMRKMQKIFARSRQALIDGIASLEEGGLIVAERKNGTRATYWPNIPAILAELQPHIAWIARALDPWPTGQGELTASGQGQLTGQGELTGQGAFTATGQGAYTGPVKDRAESYFTNGSLLNSLEAGAGAPPLDADATVNGARHVNGTASAASKPSTPTSPSALEGNEGLVAPAAAPPSKSKRRRANQVDPEIAAAFDEWYAHYPHKVAVADAEQAYARTVTGKRSDGRHATPEELLAAVQAFAAVTRAGLEDGSIKHIRYVAHPATWLNQARWKDEVSKPGQIKENGASSGLPKPYWYRDLNGKSLPVKWWVALIQKLPTLQPWPEPMLGPPRGSPDYIIPSAPEIDDLLRSRSS